MRSAWKWAFVSVPVSTLRLNEPSKWPGADRIPIADMALLTTRIGSFIAAEKRRRLRWRFQFLSSYVSVTRSWAPLRKPRAQGNTPSYRWLQRRPPSFFCYINLVELLPGLLLLLLPFFESYLYTYCQWCSERRCGHSCDCLRLRQRRSSTPSYRRHLWNRIGTFLERRKAVGLMFFFEIVVYHVPL